MALLVKRRVAQCGPCSAGSTQDGTLPSLRAPRSCSWATHLTRQESQSPVLGQVLRAPTVPTPKSSSPEGRDGDSGVGRVCKGQKRALGLSML